MEQEKLLRDASVEKEELAEQLANVREELRAKTSEIQALKQQGGRSAPGEDGRALLWRGCARIPCGAVRPHVVVKDANVYVGGGNTGKLESTRTVYKYETTKDVWSSLPITPYYTFSLALVKGQVTVVGGINVITAIASNTLATFEEDKQKWSHKFPPMPTKRCAASAVGTETCLVVVGGIAENSRLSLRTVEVLDLSTMKWAKGSPVPQPVTFMSITACSVTNRIYMLGGLGTDGAIRSVFSCYIPELMKSCQGTQEKKESDASDAVWKVITESPYYRAGCTTINGKLVIASGLDLNDTTTTLHAFDPSTKEWQPLGEMPAARTSCSLAVLSSSRLLVVGGYVDPRSWVSSLTRDVMETVNLQVP